MEKKILFILMSLFGYYYPESDHFPDSNNRKVITFRIYDPENEKLSLNIFHFPVITIRKVKTFRIVITGKCSLSGYYYPESDNFPDSNNRKVFTFRLLLSGKWTPIFFFVSLSGYYYPESDHFPDSNNRKVNTFRLLLSGKWISRKSVKNNFF